MPRKRDVGMAGSSDYATEYYSTDAQGNPVRNARTMRLQGMDPVKRIKDSQRQEERMEMMMDNGVLPSKRDRTRAIAVGASMNERRGYYSEGKYQDAIERADNKRQDIAIDRGERQNDIIAQQARQRYARQQVGKNDFAASPNARTTPTLSKMVKAGNKKKK
jgi:hypothetical protein